jgi:hypothetical protein
MKKELHNFGQLDQEGWSGQDMCHTWGKQKIRSNFGLENIKRDKSEDLRVDGRTMNPIEIRCALD